MSRLLEVLCQAAGPKSVTFLEDQTATLQVVGQPAEGLGLGETLAQHKVLTP